MGTAGGLYLFRDAILKGDPKTIIVMHADVCCSFPLEEMLTMHTEKKAIGTMLGTKVPLSPVTSLTRFPPKLRRITGVLCRIHRLMKSCITWRNRLPTFPLLSTVEFTCLTRHCLGSFGRS